MNSVFRKLLSRELGEERYEEYCKNYRSCLEEKGSADGRKQGNKVIYDELYVYLEKKDLKSLTKMVERFADTMLLARQINRQYVFAFFFSLAFWQPRSPLALFSARRTQAKPQPSAA